MPLFKVTCLIDAPSAHIAHERVIYPQAIVAGKLDQSSIKVSRVMGPRPRKSWLILKDGVVILNGMGNTKSPIKGLAKAKGIAAAYNRIDAKYGFISKYTVAEV